MKNIKCSIIALGLVAGLSTTALGQAFIASPTPLPGESGIFGYWNFNTFATTDNVLPADFGTGEISLADWGGGVGNFAGTTLNAQFSDISGPSLSLLGGLESEPGVFDGNGTYIGIAFSMENLQGLEIGFATRGTGTGFNSGLWSFSTDGVDFTAFGGNTSSNVSGWAINGTLMTAGLDGVSTAFLRYTLDGATSAAGNNRLDNVTLSATVIPEPSTYALIFGSAILGLVAVRRRFSR